VSIPALLLHACMQGECNGLTEVTQHMHVGLGVSSVGSTYLAIAIDVLRYSVDDVVLWVIMQ
jgi:hypothetical protein